MGLQVGRTGLSRALRKLSDSPAKDLTAAGSDGLSALPPQHVPGLVGPLFLHGSCVRMTVSYRMSFIHQLPPLPPVLLLCRDSVFNSSR